MKKLLVCISLTILFFAVSANGQKSNQKVPKGWKRAQIQGKEIKTGEIMQHIIFFLYYPQDKFEVLTDDNSIIITSAGFGLALMEMHEKRLSDSMKELDIVCFDKNFPKGLSGSWQKAKTASSECFEPWGHAGFRISERGFLHGHSTFERYTLVDASLGDENPATILIIDNPRDTESDVTLTKKQKADLKDRLKLLPQVLATLGAGSTLSSPDLPH